jgi:phosphoglycerol transferase MdoB-like AlkP superfamily enzyme
MSALYLLLSAVLRLVLWGSFGIAGGVPIAHLPATLSLGLLNDLVALVYITFPAALYLSLLPAKWFDSKANRRIIVFTLFAVIYGLLYLCVSEFFFFEEFDSRFNLIAVDYLIYPTEVLVNIWETYPVVKVLLATFVLTVGILKGIWPMIHRNLSGGAKFIQRAKFLAVHTVILLLVTAGVSADSLAPFANRITNELAANGITSFFHAFRTNEINYDVHYKTMDSQRAYAVMREHLKNSGGQFTADKPNTLERTFPAKPGLGKMNVVVVVEESLGSEFVGAHGDKASLTPNIDRLSKEGLFFTNMYASGTRTVRGLEAISLSLPPIPSESVVKRPGNENMTSWGKVMADNGYQTSFLYGGYGYFDNMNYFFQSNGFAISDRSEIPQPTFANIWGVSDEDLFNHAQKYFDTAAANGKPFFSIIMSTSNHKPFTFPEGVPGIPATGGGRDAGVRYADYAIGKFVEQSRSHAWFNNTLFIFVADHDARVYGKAQIPLKTYEIPMLIYAPGKVNPGEVDALASQIDIAPTVLGMLGLPYKASFYGRDVLAPNKTPNTLVFNHNYDVAILRDNQLTILGMGKKVSGFSYDRKADKQIALPVDPQSEDLAKAYYQTAYDLFKRKQY